MRNIFIFVVLCLVSYSKALECGIGKVSSEEIKKTLSMCVKNNETLEKIWEMASSSATPVPDTTQSDSSSMEEEQPKSARMSRIAKRGASNVQAKTVPPSNEEPSDKSTVAPGDTTTTSSIDIGDGCILHCVFKQMGMTDDNGLPDLTKIVEGLLKNATGRELRIFLQESAGECFQQMDQENNLDTCAYTTQLVTCLANRGRMNCEDWPAGNLPL